MPLSALISATLGVSSLLLGRVIAFSSYYPTWSAWWIGDMISILILTPFLLIWSTWPHENVSVKRLAEMGIAVGWHTTIADDLDDNVAAFRIASQRARLVLVTGGLGPTKLEARLSTASVAALRPDPLRMDQALHELHRRGFVVSARGNLTASVRGSRRLFEKVFGTRLEVFRINPAQQASSQAFYYPPANAPWQPDQALMNLIDDAYIQWPHIFMAAKKPKPGH